MDVPRDEPLCDSFPTASYSLGEGFIHAIFSLSSHDTAWRLTTCHGSFPLDHLAPVKGRQVSGHVASSTPTLHPFGRGGRTRFTLGGAEGSKVELPKLQPAKTNDARR